MKQISECIESGNLKLAREGIEAMEARLAEEASPRLHEALKAQISSLKREYSSRFKIDIPSTVKSQEAQSQTIEINIKNEFSGSSGKCVLGNRENEQIPPLHHSYVDIVNCKKIHADMIDCNETVFAKGVCDSTIHVRTRHLRLLDCTDLHLKVHSCSGVYMQNCRNITIEVILCEQPSVFDFDSPVNSQNYQLLH